MVPGYVAEGSDHSKEGKVPHISHEKLKIIVSYFRSGRVPGGVPQVAVHSALGGKH